MSKNVNNDVSMNPPIESTGSEVMFSDKRPETGTGKCQGCFRFCYLRKTLDIFDSFQKSLDVFMLSLISRHSQDKNLTPISGSPIGFSDLGFGLFQGRDLGF